MNFSDPLKSLKMGQLSFLIPKFLVFLFHGDEAMAFSRRQNNEFQFNDRTIVYQPHDFFWNPAVFLGLTTKNSYRVEETEKGTHCSYLTLAIFNQANVWNPTYTRSAWLLIQVATGNLKIDRVTTDPGVTYIIQFVVEYYIIMEIPKNFKLSSDIYMNYHSMDDSSNLLNISYRRH